MPRENVDTKARRLLELWASLIRREGLVMDQLPRYSTPGSRPSQFATPTMSPETAVRTIKTSTTTMTTFSARRNIDGRSSLSFIRGGGSYGGGNRWNRGYSGGELIAPQLIPKRPSLSNRPWH